MPDSALHREEKTVAIIGAGPAGLAAAHTLGKAGVNAQVFEASAHVGGMSRSFSLWDQTVDLGPHRFFSADARVNRLWLEAAGDRYRMVDRQTRIYYGGDLYQYPLNGMDAFRKLGLLESVHCILSYLAQAFKKDQSKHSFEHWVSRKFGQRLFDIFFKTYSEKVWGIPCDQLSADFATQRIRDFSLSEAFRSMLFPGNKRHATLIDRFAYPLGGTGSIYQSMSESLCRNGGHLFLETPVQRVLTGPGSRLQLELASGDLHSFDKVISTMPLTHLVRALPGAPDEVLDAVSHLRFRNTILVYLRITSIELFGDQWIYIHAPELEIGRITNFRNWVPELFGDSTDSILALELWCDPGDERWNKPDDWLAEKAISDLCRTGLVSPELIADSKVIRVPNCYPIYDLDYQNHLRCLRSFLDTVPGLQVIGRAGSFKYNNQDHSLLMGILAAENILNHSNHDLWAVNTTDKYQEEALIDETGLVPVLS